MAAAQSRRTFTGTVTKLHDTFGFVDEDVFFQLAACEGKRPSVGDKVLVEANYNSGMPFKWNASRVQFLGHQQHASIPQLQAASRYGGIQSGAQNITQLPQGLKFVNNTSGAGLLGPAPVNVPHNRPNQRPQIKGQRGNAPRPVPRERRASPQRNRDRKRRSSPPHRQTSPLKNRRSVSTDKSDKNQRRPAPRYMVEYVKRPLTIKASDVLHLKGLHANLYIPSDFFAINYNWHDTLPLQQPYFARKCTFHILQKDVQTLEPIPDNPPDADHTWVAKVMLLHAPPRDEIYKQCCRLAEESSEHFLHQSRVYKFLVGSKGKKELMAIGGSWSPSLDGDDPANNPRTLVNTAIRMCKALTGVDLSKCTNWRRMLEIQYHRDEEVRKGQTVPARVETTVLFLPDVHSCLPTPYEYNDLRARYFDKCDAVIAAEKEQVTSSDVSEPETAAQKEIVTESLSATTTDQTANTDDKEDKPVEVKVEVTPKQEAIEPVVDTTDASKEEQRCLNLDIKSMKVQTLRKELESRGLSTRGIKATLVERLTEAVEAEAKNEEEEKRDIKLEAEKMEVETQVEEANTTPVDQLATEEFITKDEAVGDDEEENGEKMDTTENGDAEAGQKSEKEKSDEKTDNNKVEKKPITVDPEKLKQMYTLPESYPVIPVHPNSKIKKGNFECNITPLSNLMGYKQDDNKESMFEVSLFAEAFTEMLQRNHAFNIYAALMHPLPEIETEKVETEKDDGKEQTKEKENGSDEPKAKKTKSDGGESTKQDETKQSDEKTGDKNEKKKDSEGKEKKHLSNKLPHKTKEKMYTLRKDLLLSFVYFDQTQCGYIKSGDMADIIHSIGLGLSRSQITKLLSKFLDHDVLKYRKLTDVRLSQLDSYKAALENFPKPKWEDLAVGNKALLQPVSKGGRVSPKKSRSTDGIVSFNGAVVDIKAMQDKLISGEEHVANLESALDKLKNEFDTTSKELSQTVIEKKGLEESYESTKNMLDEAKKNLKSATDKNTKFEETLQRIAKNVESVLPPKESTDA